MVRSKIEYDPNDPWRTATFEGAAIETLRRGAAWTFAERLAWNEQMTRSAIETQKRNYKNLPKGHVVRTYMESHPEEVEALGLEP